MVFYDEVMLKYARKDIKLHEEKKKPFNGLQNNRYLSTLSKKFIQMSDYK